ncbi:glycosyltransferase family 2 protein [Psychromonas aquatilis]|uniref:Glycosyltransferase family 2 protein n=1 Tax=Psychromonas aquatilis TaxID=2005072 RepID=A0ABU9GTW4_9GAMM
MIDIVLATYNGEAFIAEQIKSIQSNTGYQTRINKIIVTDDGSTDCTQKIVLELAEKDPKLIWINNTTDIHGPKSNFQFGLKQSSANYIMLCDQDDVWLPHKIETSITALLEVEKRTSPQTPLLVFSDKQIVDEQLQLICDSYFTLKNISKNWHLKFNQLCQQNVVSGCTMLVNRALINKALPIPEKAYMHDWWLALVAHRCGEIVFIDQALIQYRQHNHNTIGAQKKTFFSLCKKFITHLNTFKKSQQNIVKQAIVFKEFEQQNRLSPDTTISILSCFNDLPLKKKIVYFYNGNVTRSHLFGRIALLITLLTNKN